MDGTVHYAYNVKTGQYDIPVDDEAMAEAEPVMKSDPVNHPSHYTAGKIEVIDFLEDQNLPFHLANALKYICRAGKKNPAKTEEDLRKAVWYIERYIDHVLNAPEASS